MSMSGSRMQMKVVINSAEEMLHFGKDVARSASSGMVLALIGDLGSGKTTFLKGFISALTGVDTAQVVSPTFNYLQVFEGPDYDIYHFDLYRVTSYEQFVRTGFTDYLVAENICCLEWADRLGPHLPKQALTVELEYSGADTRCATLRGEASWMPSF